MSRWFWLFRGEVWMLPRDEVARCQSGILYHSWHCQYWRWLKVVPVCVAYWVHLIHIQLGTLCLREYTQAVHKLDGFPHCGGTAIQESGQSLRLSWMKKFWERECLADSPICAARKDAPGWIGCHPDWVKLCVGPNDRIKLRTKRSIKLCTKQK